MLHVVVSAACSRGVVREAPEADYDPKTGKLRQLTYDANQNGRNDAVSYMDGTRIVRIELDLDENGHVDRWDFYGDDGRLEKAGFSRLNDGILDSIAYYHSGFPPGTPGGTLESAKTIDRILVSTRRDGRFDRIEHYRNGVLDRAEEDSDGDGRADKWETYLPEPEAVVGEPHYGIASVAFDDERKGSPGRRITYGRGGAIVRIEVDPDRDGHFIERPSSSRTEPR
jgi:hypothetical protein